MDTCTHTYTHTQTHTHTHRGTHTYILTSVLISCRSKMSVIYMNQIQCAILFITTMPF